MAVQSLNFTHLILGSTTFGLRKIQDYSTDGEIISQGWQDEEIYSILQGLNDSLFTENPSKLYSIVISLIPGSADAKFMEAWINTVKTLGSPDLTASLYNSKEGSSYSSDEAYIVNSPRRIYTKTPTGQLFTICLNKCIPKSPEEY